MFSSKAMEEVGILDMDNPLMKESFIALFLLILQDVVDEYVGLWNLHKVKTINKNGCKKQAMFMLNIFKSMNN